VIKIRVIPIIEVRVCSRRIMPNREGKLIRGSLYPIPVGCPVTAQQ